MLNTAVRRRARWAASAVLVAIAASAPVVTGSTADAARYGDACGATIPKSTGGTWTCSFVETFDGNTLDSAKWNKQDTQISGFYLGRTCFQQGRNFQQSGGTARLTVTKSAVPFECKTPYGSFQTQYLGADINTWGKFNQTYGRFEARLKYPSYGQAGYHGGFWANPQDRVYGVWPASGEVDIAEWWSSNPTHVFPSLHYTGRTQADSGWNCVIANVSSYHTYAVEWNATEMKFIYDGQVCFTRSWSPTDVTAPAPFDQRFFLSLTFGEGYPVGSSTSATPFPATMVVDYVKAWS